MPVRQNQLINDFDDEFEVDYAGDDQSRPRGLRGPGNEVRTSANQRGGTPYEQVDQYNEY